MSATFTFDDKEWQKFLKGLEKRNKKAKKKLAPFLSPFVFKDVIEHFEKEEGPKGEWKEWSQSYDKQMTAKGKGLNKKLQDTGKLRQSFKPSDYKTTSIGIEWFNDAKTKDGFPYAAAHDIGGPKLPRRQFMWLSKKAMDKIAKASLKYLLGE